ncbi:MAG: hypothetical protein AAFQ65_14670 [Myxococcota bacterium]
MSRRIVFRIIERSVSMHAPPVTNNATDAQINHLELLLDFLLTTPSFNSVVLVFD